MNARERQIRQRLKDDFEHYGGRCLKIRTKDGDIASLVLNTAQRYVHSRLENQLRRTGKVRGLILKGRQQGVSTLVEGRYYHKVTHRRGVRAYILAHEDQSSTAIFEMAKRYHEHCPQLVKPHTRASNAKELIFDQLDSGYQIGTAGNKGAGRSKTIQYFHGSEVAFWPHAEKHMRGALQAVPNAPGTEIILESTSDGPHGVFYEMCKDALAGKGPYELIFVPWVWQAEYREPVSEDFEPTADEQRYAEEYGLDSEQLAWRRSKIAELGGVSNFRREYPATPQEAFMVEAVGALWKRDQINALRVPTAPEMKRIVVAIDPAVTSNEDSDETGIIVAGLGVDDHGYVLDDVSGKYSPAEWASKGVQVYYFREADRIIGEVNNGGDLVEVNIRTVDPDVPFTSVHASRGKRVRAEPIAALYEQGRVHHVGEHEGLEDQMVTWDPAKSTWSPDHIDALVWALWQLMIDKAEPTRTAMPTILSARTR